MSLPAVDGRALNCLSSKDEDSFEPSSPLERSKDTTFPKSAPPAKKKRKSKKRSRIVSDDCEKKKSTAKPAKRGKRTDCMLSQVRPTVVCDTANEMVRLACLNIHNTGYIDMMEWSEAVLLCLASPLSQDMLYRISWKDVKSICDENEWCVKIASAIKQHLSKTVTLNALLWRNRQEKMMKCHLTASQTVMFCTKPCVNIELLKTYRPQISVCTRTKFNNESYVE